MLNVAWAAGFFDGEGCVLIVRTGGTLRVGVDVSQVDPRPLVALAERWGGTIRTFDRKREGTRIAYTWRLYGRAAGRFLTDIRPYLVVKGEVADLAIEFASTVGPQGKRTRPEVAARRDQIRLLVRERNHRGAA